MELLHPGVFIQEVSSGLRPIEGVSTSTTAFLGKAEKGPLDRALMVTSFTEFERTFGGYLNDSYLAHAALQYYNNGGKRLYVVRVAKDAETADVSVQDRKGAPAKTITIAATSAGAWGNGLDVVIADGSQDPGDEFKLTLQQAGNVLEVHDNLSMNPDALNFAENVVNAKSQFIRVAVEPGNDSNADGTSVSGASPATSLPADRRKLRINVDGDGFQTITLANPCTTGAEIATAIQTAVRALSPLRGSTDATALSAFTAGFAAGVYTLTSGASGKKSSVQVANDPVGNAATLLRLGTTNGGSETTGAAVLRPANGTYNVGDAPVAGNVVGATLGSDGTTPQDIDFMNAFALLDIVRDVNIVAVPGIGTKAVVEHGSNYCGLRMDCFFVADMAPTDDTKEEAQTFVNNLAVKSSYAAAYFPWLNPSIPLALHPIPSSCRPRVMSPACMRASMVGVAFGKHPRAPKPTWAVPLDWPKKSPMPNRTR